MAVLAFVWPRHFQLLLNHCMWNQQTWQKCSSRDPHVVFLFRAIQTPTWQSLPLIGWDILKSPHPKKAASFEVTRLPIDVLLGLLKKCYFLEQFEIQDGHPDHFLILFRKNCMLIHQTFQKCFFRGLNVFLVEKTSFQLYPRMR